MKNILLCLLSLGCAAAFSPASRAAITVGARDNVQIGGFFSQGYVQSSGNNYPFTSRSGSDEFREMAANVSTSLGSRMRVGAQLFAQRFGPYGDDKVLLDWAVIDYNFRQELGVRAGRVKLPKSLYSEALDLDVVRPFVLLPSALYSPILRDFSASFDGAMLYGAIEAGRSSFDYKVYYGDIPMKPEQGVSDFFNNTGLFAFPAGVTSMNMDHVAGASLFWNTPVAGLKVGAVYTYFRHVRGSGRLAFAPAFIPVAPVDVGGQRYAYKTVSAEYITGAWTLAAEFQRTTDFFTVLSPLLPPDYAHNGSDAWYVSAARRLNRRCEIGGSFSAQKNLYPAPGTPRPRRLMHDSALCVRFDVNDHVLVKLEGHYVDGTMGLINTPRLPNPPALRKDTTVFWAAKTTLSF